MQIKRKSFSYRIRLSVSYRQLSATTTFVSVVPQLWDTENVKLCRGGGRQRNVDAEQKILDIVEDPTVSTRPFYRGLLYDKF